MVELWGNVLSLVGNTISVLTVVILFDAFFPRKKLGKSYLFFIAAAIFFTSIFSIFIGSRCGYTLKILFEVASYYVLCNILYESRWDRRLFIVVTKYSVLYSASYWIDVLCILLLDLT